MSERSVQYRCTIRDRVLDANRATYEDIIRVMMECDECGTEWEMMITDEHGIEYVARELERAAMEHASETEDDGQPGHTSMSISLIPRVETEHFNVTTTVE